MDSSPPPPPGFVLQSAGGPPPPPPGFTVQSPQADAAPPEPPLGQDGLPFTDRVALASADTNEERKLYLEKVYGAENVKMVPQTGITTLFGGGAKRTGPAQNVATVNDMLAVKVNGKWVNAESGSWLGGMAAEGVASSPELGLGIAGAVGGGAVGNLPGAVVGSSAGMAAGKEIEEQIKKIRGNYHLTDAQHRAALQQAALAGATSEVGGRVIGGIVRKVASGGLPNFVTGSSIESKARFQRLAAEGARPPVGAMAPGMTKLQRIEILSRKLSGAPKERDDANKAVADKLAARLLVQAGSSKQEADATVLEMKAGHEAINTADVGNAVRKRVQAHADMLQAQSDALMAGANKMVEKDLDHINDLIDAHPAGALGVDTAEAIMKSRQMFGQAATRAYDKIDEMLGGRPIVDVSPLRTAAKKIIELAQGVQTPGVARQAAKVGAKESAPETIESAGRDIASEDKELFAQLGKALGVDISLPAEGRITLGQAQRMRTIFHQLANSKDLTPNVTKHEIGQLADSMELAISSAGADAENEPAISLLKKTDSWYGENIKQYNIAQFKQLTQQFKKTGTVPDPAQVARLLIKVGQSQQVDTARKMLGEDLWKRVAAQDVRNMLDAATNPVTGKIGGVELAAALQQRGRTLVATHGKAEAEGMMALARNLSATQGELSAALTEGEFKDTIRQYEAAQAELEQFLKEDPAGALANPRIAPEQIYDTVTQPHNGALLERVAGLMGRDSPEFRDLQKTALQKVIFNSMYESAQVGVARDYVENDITREIGQYSARQQELLFPKGLAAQLREFDEDMRFLFRKPTDAAMAGFTAGSIQNQWFLRRWYTQAKIEFGRLIIDHPEFQAYLTIGRQPGRVAAAVKNTQMQLVRWAATQSSQGVFDVTDPDQIPGAQ